VVAVSLPFGATVTSSQHIGSTPETDVPDDPDYRRRQEQCYGRAWHGAHNRVVQARGQKILDQFEIGEVADSRKTEQMFLERCLRLLEPGGRLGIVLPNGNLNASSQSWLRRWAEGKALLRAVVALPPETFRFSGASITASVLFMQKFTEDDSKRWEQCWADALEETEKDFAHRRNTLFESASADLLHSGDSELCSLLGSLAALGVHRVVPKPTRARKNGLVRGAPITSLRGPTWRGSLSVQARNLKEKYTGRAARVPTLKSALSSLRASLKALDEQQSVVMWKHVREAFDYPVFMAKPKAVGITATGETGDSVPNDLPAILAAWQKFKMENLGEGV
jgi:type I restriction enzyme M protein